WNAKLLVIGHGAELAQWQERAASGLGDSLRFLGFRRDVPEVLKACDALIAPTRYEAYGLGVHEALCCGIPALVSQSAGVAERYPTQLASLLIPEPLAVAAVVDRLRDWRNRTAQLRSDVVGFSDELRATSWDVMSQQIVERIEA